MFLSQRVLVAPDPIRRGSSPPLSTRPDFASTPILDVPASLLSSSGGICPSSIMLAS
ncbi:hypothetical protein CALCODRAFT_500122 [Calocera cornea HHB12733]|uniref:Uncharacterized protein n=1 Tax=Calocera cornea HHB12733 TaxID=1353952 RepID=A0A165E6E4_9BASI|nr:hypothetical protein CALCODRAFT_500122 [Calocera cornea HHB12733]